MPLVDKEIYGFDRFVLDPVERILTCDGSPVSLTPKAFDTLICLVRNQGRMVTKDELLRQVWPDTFVEEINLAVNISSIRKTLGESPQECRFIATVPGRGYRFVAEVRSCCDQKKAGNGSAAAEDATVATDSPEGATSAKVGGGATIFGSSAAATPDKRRLFLFASPVALALAIAMIFATYLWRGKQQTKASAPVSSSIVVLPFADLSQTQDQQYFIYGLTEQLIN